MARLSVSLLGGFAVRLDERALTAFAYDKVRALLAYLAVESARPIRREHLIGLLWPDLPQAKGLSNLRTALYDLRNILRDREMEPPFLSVTHAALQLNSEAAVWIDVAAFREASAASLRGSGPDAPAAVAEAALTGVIDLYQGEFLQGFDVESEPFEDWMLVQREALHIQALDALERLVLLYHARGDHAQVLALARRQVALEPWREAAHRHVMAALAALGRRTEAVAQYETCRRILDQKLGIEPAPATQLLLAQVRAGVPVQGEPETALPTGHAPRTQTVARAELVARAGAAAQDAALLSNDSAVSNSLDVVPLVSRQVWSPETVAQTVASAETLRRQAGAAGEGMVMAAAQAALDVARLSGGSGAEALGHLYAGVVLANTTGSGFEASLAHLGRALALAQAERMPGMASEILQYLGIGSGDPEDGGEAATLGQALTLYRHLGHRVGESRVLTVLALASLDAGELEVATGYGTEGMALVKEVGDCQAEGMLAQMLGEVALLQGDYGTSHHRLQAALACFREAGLPKAEAAALRVLGALLDTLGAYERARQVVLRSFDVLPQGSGPAGVMEGWCVMARVSLHLGDEAGVAASAGKTLSLLASLGDGVQRSTYPRLRAAATGLRARVLARHGRFDAAAKLYREVLSVRLRGRWPGVGAEARAGLAALFLQQQDARRACAEIEPLLSLLAEDHLVGAVEPGWVYLTAYRALRACGDARARQVLAWGHRAVLARAASVRDEGLRRTYLEKVEANHEIVAAVGEAAVS